MLFSPRAPFESGVLQWTGDHDLEESFREEGDLLRSGPTQQPFARAARFGDLNDSISSNAMLIRVACGGQ